MNKDEFGGDKKVGTSLLSYPENNFKNWAVPLLPSWVQTDHLTMLTLVWSLINISIAFFIKEHPNLLWMVSLMILLQYLSDLFDGELGRQRNTGLIKWGFYMDHFLDYIFLCSLVFVGYMISPNGLEPWYFGLLVILGSFMVNSFLSFGATNEFSIYHYGIGPTETRIVFIGINTYIIYSGTNKFYILLPTLTIICFIGLAINTYQIQKRLRIEDMKKKGI
ncbi:MAG: hypothetical protein OEM02_11380 [Desulfobulbaceae bacterium]|nr:hypothetical protein [Desulfobulbaceae bacterium]